MFDVEKMPKEERDDFEKSVLIAQVMITTTALSFKIPGPVLVEALRRVVKTCEEIEADVEKKTRVPELEDIINSKDLESVGIMVSGNEQAGQ